MMEASPFIHRQDYIEREREHRDEFDELWRVVREEVPKQIVTSEARIVERIDAMDTRINGRIKKHTGEIAQLNDRVWLSEVFIKLTRHPLIVSIVSIGLGALVTYVATH